MAAGEKANGCRVHRISRVFEAGVLQAFQRVDLFLCGIQARSGGSEDLEPWRNVEHFHRQLHALRQALKAIHQEQDFLPAKVVQYLAWRRVHFMQPQAEYVRQGWIDGLGRAERDERDEIDAVGKVFQQAAGCFQRQSRSCHSRQGREE